MEDPQSTPELSQQFENIDFNSSPQENNKTDSNNDEQEQVNYIPYFPYCFLFFSIFFGIGISDVGLFGQQ